MNLIDKYIEYIESVKRYSPRTVAIYRRGLEEFAAYVLPGEGAEGSDADLLEKMTPTMVRNWEVELLGGRGLGRASVNQQLSLLSSFSGWLVRRSLLESNPVAPVRRPKLEKRLPSFYASDAMEEYFRRSERYADGTMMKLYPDLVPGSTKAREVFAPICRRMIVSLLFASGMRRAELIGLNISDLDLSRGSLRVRGKGDKVREIPLIPSICEEISLYLKAVELFVEADRGPGDPLVVTPTGLRLYPVFVDRAVKTELGEEAGIKGRKSPHVLRHTIATELLENGTDMYTIKEMLGHSSLAATQVYTHNSAARLKQVYQSAHPRAKNGGKNGD